MGVVGCYHLGRRKRTEKFQLKGCRRRRSSHCQEPSRRQKRRGLCERLLGRFVCCISLFVCGLCLEKFSRTRKELNFNK